MAKQKSELALIQYGSQKDPAAKDMARVFGLLDCTLLLDNMKAESEQDWFVFPRTQQGLEVFTSPRNDITKREILHGGPAGTPERAFITLKQTFEKAMDKQHVVLIPFRTEGGARIYTAYTIKRETGGLRAYLITEHAESTFQTIHQLG